MKLTFNLQSLRESTAEQKALVIGTLVEALGKVNTAFLILNPGLSPLYESGVTYDASAEWLDIPALMLMRKGDCKSLVAWRIAEMRQQGFTPKVHVVVTTVAEVDTFHVQVNAGDVLEDPSRRLGMMT